MELNEEEFRDDVNKYLNKSRLSSMNKDLELLLQHRDNLIIVESQFVIEKTQNDLKTTNKRIDLLTQDIIELKLKQLGL